MEYGEKIMNGKYFESLARLGCVTKNCSFRILFVLLFCAGFTRLLPAAGEMGVSARESGLGGAMTALADDADSINHNPAGLVHLIQDQVSTTHGFLNDGLRKGDKSEDWSLSCGIPLSRRFGAAGLSWRDVSEYGLYREQMAALGYGRNIMGRWALGIAARYLNRRTDEGAKENSDLNDIPGMIGVDAGVLGRLGSNWSIGAMANGLNEPDRAITYQNKGVIRSGIAYRQPSCSIAGQFNWARSIQGSGDDLFVTAAAEKWWLSGHFIKADVGLRGAFSFGPEKSKRLSAGVSYRTGILQFDYGFFLPVVQDQFGASQVSHRLTLTFRFGQSAPDKKSIIAKQNLRRLVERTRQEIDFYQNQTEAGLEQARNLGLLLINQQNEPDRLDEVYESYMNQYWAAKDQGVTIKVRLEMLTTLVGFFRPLGIFIRKAEKELDDTERIWSKAQIKWSEERSLYSREAARGVDPLVRLKNLSKLTKQFAPLGIDMDFVRGEMDDLKLP